MSETIISASDASLVLHRFVTEGIPVIAYFVSADRTTSATFRGFLPCFTKEQGLVVGTEYSRTVPLRAWMTFSDAEVAKASFTYADETTMPEDSGMGSGLRIHLPNGDSLTIVEKK
jgi:hypothetical protein